MDVASTAFVLMTITASHGTPTIADAAKQLGVASTDIDPSFGVVPIDPAHGKYAVQARSDAVAGRKSGSSDYAGPFSNPRIESFGPVRK